MQEFSSLRPDSPTAVEQLVGSFGSDEPEKPRRDFRNSLFSAFTPEEVNQQLHHAGLSGLRVDRVSDRHFAVHGCLCSL